MRPKSGGTADRPSATNFRITPGAAAMSCNAMCSGRRRHAGPRGVAVHRGSLPPFQGSSCVEERHHDHDRAGDEEGTAGLRPDAVKVISDSAFGQRCRTAAQQQHSTEQPAWRSRWSPCSGNWALRGKIDTDYASPSTTSTSPARHDQRPGKRADRRIRGERGTPCQPIACDRSRPQALTEAPGRYVPSAPVTTRITITQEQEDRESFSVLPANTTLHS